MIFFTNDFRSFIESKITNNNFTKRSIPKNRLIDAVCQFDIPIYKYLEKSGSIITHLLRHRFDLTNKVTNPTVNILFLYLFGYKQCYRCKKIIQLNDFNKDNKNWHSLARECKICSKNRSKEYRLNNPENSKEYYKNNKIDYVVKEAKRRAIKLNATPKWLTKAYLIEIEDIYKKAKK